MYTRQEREGILWEFHRSGLSVRRACATLPLFPNPDNLYRWLGLERSGELVAREMPDRASRMHCSHGEGSPACRQLKITIPENLDYEGLFDDLFRQYTLSHELVRVRTINMGTLYELCYEVRLKDAGISKAFLDEIRCRNGNLTVICGREKDKDMI